MATRVSGLTSKQATSITQYLKGKGNKRNILLWTLGVTTGLRISDLLRLNLSDFLDGNGKVANSITVKESKTKKARLIPVATAAREALESYREDLGGRERLFTITREQARRLIKAWCKDCNLTGNYGTHTMRKAFATEAYLNSGGDPVATARVTGHSNAAQLMAYIGATPATEKVIWNAIDKAFKW